MDIFGRCDAVWESCCIIGMHVPCTNTPSSWASVLLTDSEQIIFRRILVHGHFIALQCHISHHTGDLLQISQSSFLSQKSSIGLHSVIEKKYSQHHTGHHEAAEAAVLEAVAANAPGSILERGKLLWHSGRERRATQELHQAMDRSGLRCMWKSYNKCITLCIGIDDLTNVLRILLPSWHVICASVYALFFTTHIPWQGKWPLWKMGFGLTLQPASNVFAFYANQTSALECWCVDVHPLATVCTACVCLACMCHVIMPN